jgi:hypothetical protein
MATVQHALSRGLDLVFQLEEGETLAEPVPERANRKAILVYEATEGGAGVLNRLIADKTAIARVAHAALGMMHYENINAAIAAADPTLLKEIEHADCVRGCYRCLLSYYNQPDHELIDRTDDAALLTLLRLARSSVDLRTPDAKDETGNPWLAAAKRWGLPAPDAGPAVFDGKMPLNWTESYVAAGPSGVVSELQAAADKIGFQLFTLEDPTEPTAPADLIAALKGSA